MDFYLHNDYLLHSVCLHNVTIVKHTLAHLTREVIQCYLKVEMMDKTHTILKMKFAPTMCVVEFRNQKHFG